MRFHPQTFCHPCETPLGTLTLSASPLGLSGVFFEDQRHLPDMQTWTADAHNPFIQTALPWLQAYWAGDAQALNDPFPVPLDLAGGTDFQQSVWRALLRIPAGDTQTYGHIAKLLRNPNAVRAVGAAVGRNPISLIVPCHRILGSDGQLTGYAGGLWRKAHLLGLEKALHLPLPLDFPLPTTASSIRAQPLPLCG
jgi:methylated-DNA-[protein]-cysteine S-methyltransferase